MRLYGRCSLNKKSSEIIGNHRKISQAQALRDAGYSEAYADHPHQFRQTKAGQELIRNIDAEIKELWKGNQGTRQIKMVRNGKEVNQGTGLSGSRSQAAGAFQGSRPESETGKAEPVAGRSGYKRLQGLNENKI